MSAGTKKNYIIIFVLLIAMTIVTLKKIADFVGLLLVSESKLIPVITLWL